MEFNNCQRFAFKQMFVVGENWSNVKNVFT